VSAAVYSGLTVMPSGVVQFRLSSVAARGGLGGGLFPVGQGGGLEFWVGAHMSEHLKKIKDPRCEVYIIHNY
jgi:hypothetical protein